jgi:hypothetical protein
MHLSRHGELVLDSSHNMYDTARFRCKEKYYLSGIVPAILNPLFKTPEIAIRVKEKVDDGTINLLTIARHLRPSNISLSSSIRLFKCRSLKLLLSVWLPEHLLLKCMLPIQCQLCRLMAFRHVSRNSMQMHYTCKERLSPQHLLESYSLPIFPTLNSKRFSSGFLILLLITNSCPKSFR